ncbi:MAG: tRNA1Val (adenine37-N6)-methyltransferase [Psychromonas sp.]|jgi:tRNA1Val (adenine37-N6)-methyltransferase
MFSFKQFVIRQDKCGMKVCIDSCIFGAVSQVSLGDKVLDIGTGTGVLSLILSQKTKLNIDALEIDEDAYNQASENFSKSLFSDNIVPFHTALSKFKGTDYDVIICNPPFYRNHLSSPNKQKNKAMHQESLLLEDLAKEVSKRLKKKGTANILLPLAEMKGFETQMLNLGFFKISKLLVKHNPEKEPFREIAVFTRHNSPTQTSEFVIRETDSVTYTQEFQALMKDYYIIF